MMTTPGVIGADSISGRARRFEGPAEIGKGEGRYFRRYAQFYGRGVKRRQGFAELAE